MGQMDQDKAEMNQILSTVLSSKFTGKPLKDFEQWDVDWVNWIYIFKKVTAGVGGGYWLERSRKLNNEVIQEAIAIGQVREDAGLSSDGRNGDGVKWTDTT